MVTSWLGIDVGGKRKGFDAAVVDEHKLLTLANRLANDDVIQLACGLDSYLPGRAQSGGDGAADSDTFRSSCGAWAQHLAWHGV